MTWGAGSVGLWMCLGRDVDAGITHRWCFADILDALKLSGAWDATKRQNRLGYLGHDTLPKVRGQDTNLTRLVIWPGLDFSFSVFQPCQERPGLGVKFPWVTLGRCHAGTSLTRLQHFCSVVILLPSGRSLSTLQVPGTLDKGTPGKWVFDTGRWESFLFPITQSGSSCAWLPAGTPSPRSQCNLYAFSRKQNQKWSYGGIIVLAPQALH